MKLSRTLSNDLNSVKTANRIRAKRATYHHGDLRAALIRAADEIIGQLGIEGFSLRAAALRAGVSPAAPAHHFGSARGLLTEVAILAYQRAAEAIGQNSKVDDVVADVRAITLAFIHFVLQYPGHFRLMFRNDLVDRRDPRLAAVSKVPGMRLGQAILAYQGKPSADPGSFSDAADMLCGLATLHGLANLVLEEKAIHFFQGANHENFVRDFLPRVIEHRYPYAVR